MTSASGICRAGTGRVRVGFCRPARAGAHRPVQTQLGPGTGLDRTGLDRTGLDRTGAPGPGRPLPAADRACIQRR